jgi:sugar phosphate permease
MLNIILRNFLCFIFTNHQEVENLGTRHSKLTMTSYSVGNVVGDLLGGILSETLFAFYKTVVELNTLLTEFVLVIFTL